MFNLLYIVLELLFYSVTQIKPSERVKAKSNAPLAIVVALVLVAIGMTIYVNNPKPQKEIPVASSQAYRSI